LEAHSERLLYCDSLDPKKERNLMCFEASLKYLKITWSTPDSNIVLAQIRPTSGAHGPDVGQICADTVAFWDRK